MTDLVRERCMACRRDSPRVTDAEVALLHPQVPEWDLIQSGGVDRLRRIFRFREYRRAVDFAVAVADLAEEEGHHPRLTVEWGRVTVDWWTHAIGGLHRNDFVMAAKTDRAFEEGGRQPSFSASNRVAHHEEAQSRRYFSTRQLMMSMP